LTESLYTIGSSGKALRQFAESLRRAGIDLVIDTRLQNTSQLAGFAKREHLEYLLPELLGIGYRHEPALSPAPGMFQEVRSSKDWESFEVAFQRLMEERRMVAIVERAAGDAARPCLLCVCQTERRCHRRLVAEAVAAARPGLRVEHL
jgi:uncharacterized protein (DUF488 family)